MEDFTAAYDQWWPTWGGNTSAPEGGASKDAAMAVDWVRYWEPGAAEGEAPQGLRG